VLNEENALQYPVWQAYNGEDIKAGKGLQCRTLV
jgi:hypothetical protein